MPIFTYKAKDKKGIDIKGTVEAQDQKTALAILREKGYFCYWLQAKSEGLLALISNKLFQRVSVSDIANFTRQLSTMVSSGLPLTDALSILKTQGKGKMAAAATEILHDVEGGSSLAESLKKFPKIFSSVYIALVRAGESAGVLDNILARLADNLETQREFRAKIKGALLYPIIIVIGMSGVMSVMMIFVVPKLTALYKEFDAKLPQMTLILITFSNLMVSYWWLLLIGIVGLAYLYKMVNRTRAGKKKIDLLKFKIPVVGKLQVQVILAELTRTMGLLIGAGVPITETLEISSKTANNVLIEEGILEANEQVEKGMPLSVALTDNKFFPPILSQMLAVGEETGKMDEVLLKLSRFFQSESEELLKGLTTALEPLIMILLGVGVGFLVIAIILPIYNLTSQF